MDVIHAIQVVVVKQKRSTYSQPGRAVYDFMGIDIPSLLSSLLCHATKKFTKCVHVHLYCIVMV